MIYHHVNAKKGLGLRIASHMLIGRRRAVFRWVTSRDWCRRERAHPHAYHLSLCNCQLGLEGINLLLQRWNGSNTTINWVSDSSICFIHHWTHCITTLVLRQFLQILQYPHKSLSYKLLNWNSKLNSIFELYN